ncbi:hypothetical protein GCM10022280_02860 [Sphingomonas swuensis]|uniref:Uncharacterized protein n=1 Tax=Sphingomonas swuensis TaxID=977800 RepID=A0ABP7SBD5_9SPHN
MSAYDPLRPSDDLTKVPSMNTLTPLENAALTAIFNETPELAAELEEQRKAAEIISRENDRGGFFTYFSVPERLALSEEYLPLGDNVYAAVEGLEYGLGFLLIIRDGRMHVLDGYTIGVEDTGPIDFETAAFKVRDTPFEDE